MEIEDFPSNSMGTPKVEEKEIPKKVVTGKVITRKPPMGRRVREMFFGGDFNSVRSYVIDDVLLPAARDMIADAFSQGVERLIFGDSRPGGGRRYASRTSGGVFGGGVGRTAYDRMSTRRDDREPMSRRARANHNFEEIILQSRAEAEDVLEQMDLILERYKQVSVKDLYELVGENFHYTDEKWGWTGRGIGGRVTRTSNGYLLDLPRPEQLD
jgi:hypothetical protein